MPQNPDDGSCQDWPRPTNCCRDCGAPLVPADKSCPQCGSGNRQIFASDSVTLDLNERVDLKQFKPGEKKPFCEVRCGASFFHKTGEWHQIRRIIDRENDWYYEHIEDEHGNVVRHVEEPLTQHQGHGAAKQERRP